MGKSYRRTPEGGNSKNNDTIKHRIFETGATRDTANGKLEYSNYIHPLADYSFAEYMKSKQIIGGQYRRGDNWQKGIPEESLFDSMIRHIEILKLLRKGFDIYELETDGNIDLLVLPCEIGDKVSIPEGTNAYKKDIESELNAIRFNSEAMKLYYIEGGYNL